jgi:ABC-2 type transport system ATP-binding protein
MEAILRVENLKKSFDGTPAVRDISFAIQPGEIFGLLGANGAGKTTTIQMLLGVLTPDGGSITAFGRSLADDPEFILGQMNFSSSYVSLPFNLSVEENLRVFARLYGVPNPEARIDELLTLFDLLSYRRTVTGKLSSGQLTRVYLAKALINHPKLLLLDEPTASLDPDIADRTRTTLRDLAKNEGVALLYTSHNMAEVETMCERVAFLHKGVIRAEGRPADMVASFDRKNLEDLFLHIARGEPSIGDEL